MCIYGILLKTDLVVFAYSYIHYFPQAAFTLSRCFTNLAASGS